MFPLPTHISRYEIKGLIGRGGMGIRFEKVEARSQALINTFVDGHFFSNREPASPHDTSRIG